MVVAAVLILNGNAVHVRILPALHPAVNEQLLSLADQLLVVIHDAAGELFALPLASFDSLRCLRVTSELRIGIIISE